MTSCKINPYSKGLTFYFGFNNDEFTNRNFQLRFDAEFSNQHRLECKYKSLQHKLLGMV